MLYGKEATITFDKAQFALRSKEMQMVSKGKVETAAESLNVKHEPKKKRGENGGEETRSCQHCKKPGHLKRDCFVWKNKQAQKEQAGNLVDIAEYVEV